MHKNDVDDILAPFVFHTFSLIQTVRILFLTNIIFSWGDQVSHSSYLSGLLVMIKKWAVRIDHWALEIHGQIIIRVTDSHKYMTLGQFSTLVISHQNLAQYCKFLWLVWSYFRSPDQGVKGWFKQKTCSMITI